MKRLEPLFAAIAVAILPSIAGAQTSYNLINLDAGSPYDGISANSINSAGHITGYGVVALTGEIHTFIYHDGVFQDLGLLGYQASDGICIDNSDQLAVDGIGPGSTALLYSGGHARRIGSIDGGYTYVYGMNNLGDIVGKGANGDGGIVGFSWVGGVFTDLSSAGVMLARSINDSRQIAGSSMYCWSQGGGLVCSSHGCLYAGGALTDLGSLSGNPRLNTEAFGINNAGQIVGYSTAADGRFHAFLYTGGAMQDLGTLYGDYATAVAINNNGLIVGTLANPYGVTLGSFVYSNGTMSDLGNLIVSGGTGWSELAVAAVNDSGEIVGSGTYNGGTHGFLAVPTVTTDVATAQANARTAIAGVNPNPFKPSTEITFTVSAHAAAGDSRLEIFDPAGRRVTTLVSQRLAAGEHAVTWNGRAEGGAEIPSGVYFARLTTQDGAETRKLLMLK